MDEVGTTDILEEVVGTQEIEVEEEPLVVTFDELERMGMVPWWNRGKTKNIVDDPPPVRAPTSDHTMTFVGNVIADPITMTKLKNTYGGSNPLSLDSFRGAGVRTPTTRPVKMSDFRGLGSKATFTGIFYIDRWGDFNLQYPDNAAEGNYENPQYSWNNNDNRYIGEGASHFSQYRGIFANEWDMVNWCDNNPAAIESVKEVYIKTRGRHKQQLGGSRDGTRLDVYMMKKNADSFEDCSSYMRTTSKDGFTSIHAVELETKVKSINQFNGITSYQKVKGSNNAEKEENLKNFIANGFLLRFQATRNSDLDPRPLQTEIYVNELVVDFSK